MTLDKLKAQLAELEKELEPIKASLYRLDGAIQIIKHLIVEEETPIETAVVEGEVI